MDFTDNEKILLVVAPILIGFLLDFLIGDPYSWPHPIKLFGNTISYFEKRLNIGLKRAVKGGIISVFLIIVTFAVFFAINKIIAYEFYTNIVITSILIFYGLANRTLIREVKKVNRELSEKGLEAGRKQLSYIVGRDTSKLNEQQIRIASLETLAENLSDGVIAPLFYLFIGGFPLMFTYKMVNTLDSMIGYKSDRYKDFGMVAAKIDDALNYIPARITAILLAIVSFKARAFKYIFRYGKKHSSPNAGFPEAAMAGALNCRFGGPSEYYGTIVEKPYIGKNERTITYSDTKYACRLNLWASVLFLVLGIGLLFVWYTL